jgi:hypothetical protein
MSNYADYSVLKKLSLRNLGGKILIIQVTPFQFPESIFA